MWSDRIYFNINLIKLVCREEEGGKLALDVQIREERGVENFLRQTKIKGGGIGIKFISFFVHFLFFLS